MFARLLSLRTWKPSLSKFCQMRLNVMLFRFLPSWFSRCYLRLLGKIYYLLNWKERKLIQATITRILGSDLEPAVLRRLKRRTFRGAIDHYHEKLFVAYSHFGRLVGFLRRRVRLEGAEALEEALAAGRGVILVTGHYGAVEFLPGALAVRNYPATMICRFQTNRLRLSMQERAGRVGLELVDSDGSNVLLTALKALKRGRILITECDEFEEWRPDPARQVTFLGNRLDADRTLEILRRRSGAPVVTALLRREGGRRYTLHFTPIAAPAATAAEPVGISCLKVLEAAVDADPVQWYQWRKFGTLIQPLTGRDDAHQESGYLAPEIGVSIPVQA
ncbi:MAG: hypothetical protein FJ128_03420 [Deltaproteobacteria bacterium]|nr:hypothetical protein [Deltaproteobacteria bacterium]